MQFYSIFLFNHIEKKNNLLRNKHVELKIELILNKIEGLQKNELPLKKNI